MTRRLTAIVERDGDGYVALCPELDVASQGETVVEARDSLAEALLCSSKPRLPTNSTDACVVKST